MPPVLLNPDADLSVGDWTTGAGGGSSLFAEIDEDTPSDGDLVRSAIGPVGSTYEASLEAGTDPGVSTGHVVHYRYNKSQASDTLSLVVSLLAGSVPSSVTNTAGTNAGTWGDATATSKLLQGFPWGGGGIANVALRMRKVGAPTDNLLADIFAVDGSGVPTGSSLGQASVVGSTLTTGDTEITFTFASPVWVVAGQYAIVLSRSGAVNGTNYYGWSQDGSGTDTYAGGRSGTWNGTTWGMADAFDKWFTVNGTNVVASWTHSNVSSSFVTADQTLSAGQADAISDYTDLKLRFVADTVVNDTTPAKVADQGTSSQNAGTTAFSVGSLGSVVVGNYLILRIAADNSGGGGAARNLTITDPRGNVWAETILNYDPGAASAGTTAHLAYCKVETAYQGGDSLTLTFSGSVVMACVLEEWSDLHPTTPIRISGVGNSGTSANPGLAFTNGNYEIKDLLYCHAAIEGPDADSYTEDSDSSSGSWVSLTRIGTTNATATDNQKVVGAYKLPSANTFIQNWDPTITSRDWAAIAIAFARGPAKSRVQVSWAQFEIPSAGGDTAPTAAAGADQNVNGGAVVTLDGTGSSDPEGAVTYSWEQLTGTVVTLSSTTAAQPTFTAPNVTESLTFRLTVTDSASQTDTDDVAINVTAVEANTTNRTLRIMTAGGLVEGTMRVMTAEGLVTCTVRTG